jgi:hypothetical protein
MEAATRAVREALSCAFGAPLEVAEPGAPELQCLWRSVNHIEIALCSPVNERRHRTLWTRRQAGRGVPLSRPVASWIND